MQGKGLLKVFLILLSIVCVIQLFYFIPTGRIEREADEFATTASSSKTGLEKDMAFKMARSKYLDSMSTEKVFSIPGLGVDYTYSDLKQKQLNLGLDLKGGMSTLLEVDLSQFVISMAGRNGKDPLLQQAVDAARKAQVNDQSNFISLFAREYKRLSNGRSLASLYSQNENLGQTINLETPDAVVEKLLRTKADETVNQTFETLKKRIDKLGVVQPNITLDKSRDLILVEMPGVDNPERARKMVTQGAVLEFWETYRVTDAGIAASLVAADKRIGGDTSATTSTSVLDTTKNAKTGALLSALQLNNPQAPSYSRNIFGVADKNKKDDISLMLARPDIRNLFPQNLMWVWSQKPEEDPKTKVSTNKYGLYAVRIANLANDAPGLDGSVVTRASMSQDQFSGEPEVSLSMNANGAKKWAELTTRAYNGDSEGKQREIAITLDKEVVTAPSVNNGPITGGNSSISGNFNVQEAKDLASVLEVGKLPATPRIVQESNVGPSLGQENISKSMNALIIGFIMILLFMTLYYAKGGIVSIIALLANIVFILGTLSSLGTVLTLPGIAGIVLTIGMAVDANVIIYERIKEELRHGASNWQAIKEGFKASYSPIIDGNFTTLIVGLVLIYFGLGPIKGFGVVLVVGILTTLLTALLFSQMIVEKWTNYGEKEMTFYNNWSKNILTNINFDWMSKRKWAYIFSGSLLLLGLISIFTRGFDLGVDFKGGHSYVVHVPTSSNVTTDKLVASLEKVFGAAPIVKKVDIDNTYNITTAYKIDDSGDGVYGDVTSKLFEGLQAATGSKISKDQFMSSSNNDELKIESYSKVGATIADDIKQSSWKAAFAALFFIFLYILFRFSKWQYSAGAVIATAHDALITIGIFSLLKGLVPWSLEVDGAFVAAILTLIGYSINDTVIVFDRVREYVKKYPEKPRDEVYNAAINSTFSRTVFTSLTVLFVVIALFFFGGASLKNFSFALLIGVAFGTYSSVFVATTVMRDLTANFGNKK